MIDTTDGIKKAAAKTNEAGERLIKKNDMVNVVGTGNGRFIKKGAKLELHRTHADELVRKGAVKIVSDADPEKNKLRARKGNG